MNREDFIKAIPKPSNEDVILYDLSLKDLIDIDVPTEYNKLLPVFKEEKSNFLNLKEEIKAYRENIDQVFLLNPSWTQEIYLQKLQEDTQTFSLLYGNIKRKEEEIKIMLKKIEGINDKIIIQKNKEEKEYEEKKLNINNKIEENKTNLIKFKDTIDVYKNSLKRIEEQIKNIKTDLKSLKEAKVQVFKGTYECFCCGKKVKETEAGKVTNKIEESIQKNNIQLDFLLDQKEKIKSTLNYYKSELVNTKIELQNNTSFKKNYKNLYVKKSVEILKLEASKNECLNKLAEKEKELAEEPQINSKKLLELKNRIEKYKTSLDNLKKINNLKGGLALKIKKYDERQKSLKEKETLIIKYLSFLRIYYKIYEQKASQYAGQDYKIKLFEIKNLDIIKILNIIYKGTEYSQLSKKDKAIVDKNLIEKFDSNI